MDGVQPRGHAVATAARCAALPVPDDAAARPVDERGIGAGRGCIPADPRQTLLPNGVPRASGFPGTLLPPGQQRSPQPRLEARWLLRRLLLGADAVVVRRRRDEP